MARDPNERNYKSNRTRKYNWRADKKAEKAEAKEKKYTYKPKRKIRNPLFVANPENFPKHKLIKQADGSYRSPVYTFDVSRWG